MLCEAGWLSGLRCQSLMQDIEGSDPELGKFFFHIFLQKKGYKSLYREQGNPCTDYRETLYRFQRSPCTYYRETLYGLQGRPCSDREILYRLQGKPCRDYRKPM